MVKVVTVDRPQFTVTPRGQHTAQKDPRLDERDSPPGHDIQQKICDEKNRQQQNAQRDHAKPAGDQPSFAKCVRVDGNGAKQKRRSSHGKENSSKLMASHAVAHTRNVTTFWTLVGWLF